MDENQNRTDDKASDDSASIDAEQLKLREISEEELKQIFEDHQQWLESDEQEGLMADLRGVNLSGSNLSPTNLSGANLRRANLTGADLTGMNLSRSNLSRSNLSGSNLSQTNLSGANLRRANLSGANLCEADLSEAYLRKATLSGADLSRTNLRRANLRRANLNEANLMGANLRESSIPRAILKNTNLQKVILNKADLHRSDLSLSDLSSSFLNFANLSETKLHKTKLNYANLTNAIIRGAYLTGADLSGAILEGTDLTASVLDGALIDKTTKYRRLLGVQIGINGIWSPSTDSVALLSISKEKFQEESHKYKTVLTNLKHARGIHSISFLLTLIAFTICTLVAYGIHLPGFVYVIKELDKSILFAFSITTIFYIILGILFTKSLSFACYLREEKSSIKIGRFRWILGKYSGTSYISRLSSFIARFLGAFHPLLYLFLAQTGSIFYMLLSVVILILCSWIFVISERFQRPILWSKMFEEPEMEKLTVDLLTRDLSKWNRIRAKHPAVKPNLREAKLQKMELKGANLRQADLTNAKLAGTNLEEAILNGANLEDSDLRGSILINAYLKFVHLRNAKIDKRIKTQGPIKFQNPILEGLNPIFRFFSLIGLRVFSIKGCLEGVNGFYCKGTDSAALLELSPPGNSMLGSNPDAVIESLKRARRLNGFSMSLVGIVILISVLELTEITFPWAKNVDITSSQFGLLAMPMSIGLLSLVVSFFSDALKGAQYLKDRSSAMSVGNFPWSLSKYAGEDKIAQFLSFITRMVMSFHPIIYIYILGIWRVFNTLVFVILSIITLVFCGYVLYLSEQFQKPILFDTKTEEERKDSIEKLTEVVKEQTSVMKGLVNILKSNGKEDSKGPDTGERVSNDLKNE